MLVVGTYLAGGAVARGDEDFGAYVLAIPARVYGNFDAPLERKPTLRTEMGGAPILGLNVMALGGIFLGANASDPARTAFYVLGAPTVHRAEADPDKAGAGFALHITPPALVFTLTSGAGCLDASSRCRSRPAETQTSIFTVLLPSASLIDSGSRARKRVTVARALSMRLEPWINPLGSRYGASVTATF